MPNDGAMTPKAIAKMIKAKGLQKLRWYCQMCQKQCRDANGFKCHIESESHERNMLLFAEKPGQALDEYSKEFEAGMMDIIKRRFRSTRVHANVVYNEYIKDRNHTHMNATRWTTLTGFVMYLGKSGKCKVEETPKGWYVTYIERDPEILERQARAERKEKMDMDDEQRVKMMMEQRVQYAKDHMTEETHQSTELKRDGEPLKLSFSMKPKSATTATTNAATTSTNNNNNNTMLKKAFGEVDDDTANDDNTYDTIENIETIDFEGEPLDEFSAINQEKPTNNNNDIKERVEPQAINNTNNNNNSGGVDKPKEEQNSVSASKAVDTHNDNNNNNNNSGSKRTANGSVEKEAESSKKQKSEPIVTSQTIKSTSSSSHSKWDSKTESTSQRERQTKEPEKKKLTAMEEIMAREEMKKDRLNRKDYWLAEGIVVKVINKQLANGKYYKLKGVIKKVSDLYKGYVHMLDSGDVLVVDQAHLETVLPNFGGKVLVVNGAYRGEEGILLSIDENAFKAQVKLQTGSHLGLVVNTNYEDVSKMHIK